MEKLFTEAQNKNLLKGTDDAKAFDLLTTIIKPLAFLDDDYPRRVFNYIIVGDDEEILSELHNRDDDKATGLLGFPGCYFSKGLWSSDLSGDECSLLEKTHKVSTKARSQLNNCIFEILTTKQIIRYSKFLAQVNNPENHTDFADSPKWFNFLIVDGAYTLAEQDSAWRYQDLLHLLETAGVDEPVQALLNIMFQRNNMDKYDIHRLNDIYLLTNTHEFLIEHVASATTHIPTLSEQTQTQYVDFPVKKNKELIHAQAPLLVNLATNGQKKTRIQAINILAQCDYNVISAFLEQILQTGTANQRRFTADILVHFGSDSRPLLEQAIEEEKQKSVIKSLESALARLIDDSDSQTPTDSFELPALIAIDDQHLPATVIDIFKDNHKHILKDLQDDVQHEIEFNNKYGRDYTSDQDRFTEFEKINIDELAPKLLDALNGIGGTQLLQSEYHQGIIFASKTITHLPEYNLHHACRMACAAKYGFETYSLEFNQNTSNTSELRQLAHLCEQYSGKEVKRNIAEDCLSESRWFNEHFPHDDQVVPFFIENIDFIAESLRIIPCLDNTNNCHPEQGMKLLRRFPHIPSKFISKIVEFAVGDTASFNLPAQETLQSVPHIHKQAIELLNSAKQNVRLKAIAWLLRINTADTSHQQAIIDALQALKKKEKKEVIQASLLEALEILGVDISNDLSPDNLLKNAEKGLKAKTAKSFTWFDETSLPAVQWHSGQTVNPIIIHWWFVLAEKLKDPMPNGLLQRYVDLLDAKSQKTLSLFALEGFINQDLHVLTLEEATAIAKEKAPALLQEHQEDYKQYGSTWSTKYAHMTLEEVELALIEPTLTEFTSSAIKSKGILALAYKAEGGTAVKLLQKYLKQHKHRHAQATAMITAFAFSADPSIIQWLLGLSRRYRSESIKELAQSLVTGIAERNNWTADELADRTIPTAGVADNGVLTLDYGTRTFTAHINDEDAFVLKKDDGKTIKSLPNARKDDDKDIIKETKAFFSTCKKELKQVLQEQSIRLYESMCSERLWTASDWQKYLFAHPLMQRLITRLLWLEVDADNTIVNVFRPSNDGCLLDDNDEEISLQTENFVKLAHVSLVGEASVKYWLSHFNDYETLPLFSQLENVCPQFADDAHGFSDFNYYTTGTYTLMKVMGEMNYQREAISDGGGFAGYYKSYPSLGISAVISFSGSYAYADDMPVAIYDLTFERHNINDYNNHISLKEISPILLAESYAEYKKLADHTDGFDPSWKR